MTQMALEGHHGRGVVIDICGTCQAIWFDGYESLQLSAASVLELFQLIGNSGGKVKAPLAPAADCPRCQAQLRTVKDMQRTTRFEYRACPHRHGRLITFFNFLREKNFIRPMTAAQIEELRRNIRTVNCSNCGAPVDLAAGSECEHCGSPLSMVDVQQAEKLVEALEQAGAGPQPVDRAALPLDLARARREVTDAFAGFANQPNWFSSIEDAGTVGAAMAQIATWLRR
jgi:Zn-finger nucleic acid-binding protein/DNA-directed RNA polymerase subunit RPC12/RpoP